MDKIGKEYMDWVSDYRPMPSVFYKKKSNKAYVALCIASVALWSAYIITGLMEVI